MLAGASRMLLPSFCVGGRGVVRYGVPFTRMSSCQRPIGTHSPSASGPAGKWLSAAFGSRAFESGEERRIRALGLGYRGGSDDWNQNSGDSHYKGGLRGLALGRYDRKGASTAGMQRTG
eukprot:474396-Prorocentrum_minimum.AAC.2